MFNSKLNDKIKAGYTVVQMNYEEERQNGTLKEKKDEDNKP